MSHKDSREGRAHHPDLNRPDRTSPNSRTALDKTRPPSSPVHEQAIPVGWTQRRVGGSGNCFFLSLAVALNFQGAAQHAGDVTAIGDELRALLVTKDKWDRFIEGLDPEIRTVAPPFSEASNPRVDVEDFVISFISSTYGLHFYFPQKISAPTTCDWAGLRPVVYIAGGAGHYDPLLRDDPDPQRAARVLLGLLKHPVSDCAAWDMLKPSPQIGFEVLSTTELVGPITPFTPFAPRHLANRTERHSAAW